MADPISEKRSSASNSPNFKKEKTAEEQIQQARENFVKIMSATFKHQNPDNPASSEQIAQTTAIMLQAEESIKANSVLHKIKDALTDNKLTKALPFHGKNVQYDASKKTFDGKTPVEFQYQLKYNDQSKPSDAHISTVVTVLDERGIKILQTKGNSAKGANSFRWDGKDALGKKVAEGTYRIKVESAFERMVDGKLIKTPIEAGAFISGTVDSVDVQDGEVKLQIGGKFISLNDIIKIEKEERKDDFPQISDYANYIGQTAEVSDDQITVKIGGNAELTYKCELERPGKASVHIIDTEGNLVGVAVVSGIKKGLNNLKIKASCALTEEEAEKVTSGEKDLEPVPSGKYRCELFVQDTLDQDPNKYTKVSTARAITITALDFSAEPYVLSGEEKFRLDAIRKLSAKVSKDSLFQEAAPYLGKIATLSLNRLKLEAGVPAQQYVRIEPCEQGSHYGSAYINIFDPEGRQIASVKKPAEALLFAEKEEFFNIDNLFNFLTPSSKKWICNQNGLDTTITSIEGISNAIAPETQHDTRLQTFKETVWDYLVKQDENVQIEYASVLPLYDKLSPDDQELAKNAIDHNLPATGFKWSGKDSSGKNVTPGTYKYEFIIEKIHTNPASRDTVTEIVKIDDKMKVRVREYTTEHGEIKFIGNRVDDSGNIVEVELIEFSREEISQLSS